MCNRVARNDEMLRSGVYAAYCNIRVRILVTLRVLYQDLGVLGLEIGLGFSDLGFVSKI